MKSKPFVLWVVVTAWFGLCGLTKTPSQGSGKSHDVVDPQRTPAHQTAAEKNHRAASSAVGGDQAPAEKSLDLSVPFQVSDAPAFSAGNTATDQQPLTDDHDLFVRAPIPSQTQLQLKGGWIMSQEPEKEKRNSVDGASIGINLRQ